MGTVLGNPVIVVSNKTARLRIEWQLASQNIPGNYSTINWQAYVDFIGCDAQLDNGFVGWNGGTLYDQPGRVYNYAANFSNHTVGMGSGSFNVGHAGNGTGSFSIGGDVAVFQSGTSSGSGGFGLPTIPRYATINGFNIDWVTDAALRFAWHSDSNVDFISWWSVAYDGGGHHDIPASGQGWFAIELFNLLSEKTYDITVAVRRADSGLWTTSGTQFPTTLKQNNMFPMRVP
jgi:hypothetical protein